MFSDEMDLCVAACVYIRWDSFKPSSVAKDYHKSLYFKINNFYLTRCLC